MLALDGVSLGPVRSHPVRVRDLAGFAALVWREVAVEYRSKCPPVAYHFDCPKFM